MTIAGFVSLVGAGPGDPELLTLKGLRRLQEAEAVVYDRLVAPELLDHCPPSALRYDVGKIPGTGGYTQQTEINALLVRLGQEGLRVVRLKGGDPYVFGRGGEEAFALVQAGIPFEVVPGVSAALAAPAAAGIPVTHRNLARAVTVATGHDSGNPHGDHDWETLAHTRGTLVFLMAVEKLPTIVAQLCTHGRGADEPAAVVQWATTPQQRVVHAPLGEIAQATRDAGITAPAVLVIGPTVALAPLLGVAKGDASAAVRGKNR